MACDGACLKSQRTASSNGLLCLRNDLQGQLLFRTGFDPPQHPAARIVTILLDRVDLAAAGRRAGHFGPVGQADRHGDLFGRHVAGILQQDLVGRLLADHDLPRSDGFHRQQRTLVIDQNARLLGRRQASRLGVAGWLGSRRTLRTRRHRAAALGRRLGRRWPAGSGRGAGRPLGRSSARPAVTAGLPPALRQAEDRPKTAWSGPCRRTATGGRPSVARAAASRQSPRGPWTILPRRRPPTVFGGGGSSAGPLGDGTIVILEGVVVARRRTLRPCGGSNRTGRHRPHCSYRCRRRGRQAGRRRVAAARLGWGPASARDASAPSPWSRSCSCSAPAAGAAAVLTAVVEQVGEKTVERPELIRVVLGHCHPGQAHETYHDRCRSNFSIEHGVTHPLFACCPSNLPRHAYRIGRISGISQLCRICAILGFEGSSG